MKFNVVNFGLALGIVVGLGAFIFALIAAGYPAWHEGVTIWGKFYLGYEANFSGALIGAIWGFVDGFFGGAIFAWVYNKLQK